MSFNDNAVLTAARGYIFVGPTGTSRPTPAQVADLEPDTFGAHQYTLAVTGSPTGGTYTLTVDSKPVAALPLSADLGAIEAALGAVVGSGNVALTGGPLATAGVEVAFIGKLQGKSVSLTVESSLTDAGEVTVTETAVTNGWTPIGHTSEGDLPELGFEGGDTEVRNTWQRTGLREVNTDTPYDYMTMKLAQFDASGFQFYYGDNASTVDGVFGVDSSVIKPVERALFMLIVDGDLRVGFRAAKASIRRDESISLATDEFGTLPVRATFIKHPGNHLFEWITPVVA
ncbi:major tail protein [Rhodococcus phage WC1]|uniref:Major tail protein n=2 Tax=Rerduovirus RER2 TaxID=1982376 RepID=G9FHR1_9CAUD|nr:major tail protein [Rhodococcus phage RER2]YP_009189671.1 major tail protein [Rhodococcus phage CosmicSans]ALA46221.1 major tail protein [Rhodococcus phage Rhodalysa]ALN97062.1 major tail protein [Rhodococcus phage TWAMP]ALO80616.1 major tail protein [Rhodococcus phage Lillie]AOQ27467.1 major tail protein [Rhodococcus phage Natosaleda]ASR84267.1 major tail protein [Rhodococcus phage StCroix]ASR84331.1 major tail protein [Rhodococcus phage Naiad]ASR84529.1 major tail protein [Rhodococcus 